MLEASFIRDHLDAVRTNCKNRNLSADLDRIVQLDDDRRQLTHETQLVQQRQNEVSKLIPKEKDAALKQALIQEGRTLRDKATGLESRLKEIAADLHQAIMKVPNMSHP